MVQWTNEIAIWPCMSSLIREEGFPDWRDDLWRASLRKGALRCTMKAMGHKGPEW